MADHRFPQLGPDGYVSPYSDIDYSKGPKVIYGDTDVLRLILNDPQTDEDDEWGRTEHIGLRQLTDEAITVRKALFGWSSVSGLLDKWDYFETNHFAIDYVTSANSVFTIGNTTLQNGQLQLVTGTKYSASEFTMNSEYFKIFKVGTLGMKAQAGDNSGGDGDVVAYWYPAPVGDPDSSAAFVVTVNNKEYRFTDSAFSIPSGASFSAGNVTFTNVTTDGLTVGDRIVFSTGGVLYNQFCGSNFWMSENTFHVGSDFYSSATLQPTSLTFSDSAGFVAGSGLGNKVILNSSSNLEIALTCPGYMHMHTDFGVLVGPSIAAAATLTPTTLTFRYGQTLVTSPCGELRLEAVPFQIGTASSYSALSATSLLFSSGTLGITEQGTPGCGQWLRAQSATFEIGTSSSNAASVTPTSMVFSEGLSFYDSAVWSSRQIVFDSSNGISLQPFCGPGEGLASTADVFAVGDSNRVYINTGSTLASKSIDFGSSVLIQGGVCPNHLRVQADLFKVGTASNNATIGGTGSYLQLANGQGALTQNYVAINMTTGNPGSGTYSNYGAGTIRVFTDCGAYYIGVYSGSSWYSVALA